MTCPFDAKPSDSAPTGQCEIRISPDHRAQTDTLTRALLEIHVGGVSRISCQETASAPTIKYSTVFEFKHSINSRKSSLKDIAVGSLAKFEENSDSLLGAHRRPGRSIGRVRFLEALEDANNLLHRLIIPLSNEAAPAIFEGSIDNRPPALPVF